MLPVILASESPSRKEQFAQLNIDFTTDPSNIDETPMANETAPELVIRLAIAKAKEHKTKYPQHLIIGCDQVAEFNAEIFGKPKNRATTIAVLSKFSGSTIRFWNGLAVYNTQTNEYKTNLEYTDVTFKHLTTEQIEDYLKYEQPYNCAGALRSEGIGISLIDSISCADPTMLKGIPLIRLRKLLESFV